VLFSAPAPAPSKLALDMAVRPPSTGNLDRSQSRVMRALEAAARAEVTHSCAFQRSLPSNRPRGSTCAPHLWPKGHPLIQRLRAGRFVPLKVPCAQGGRALGAPSAPKTPHLSDTHDGAGRSVRSRCPQGPAGGLISDRSDERVEMTSFGF
jgi:hypothetical protein